MTPPDPAWPVRDPAAVSVFRPEALLREARRQRGLPLRDVPSLCVLDPDGDLVQHLRAAGRGRPSEGWACYHTDLLEFELAGGGTAGVVGRAVGAPFAVLVAEQLFASGCRHLISITSAGRIVERGPPPYVVLIDRALRDEGTSGHYLPPDAGSVVSAPDPARLDRIEASVRAALQGVSFHRGLSWTTDAPYRETEAAIAAARNYGALAVEMEAAALLAFAGSRSASVTCFAHVSNTPGQQTGQDFEKGESDGVGTAMTVIEACAAALSS